MKNSPAPSPSKWVLGEKYVERNRSMWWPLIISARLTSAENRAGTTEHSSSKRESQIQEMLRNATSRLLDQLIPMGYGFCSCQLYHCSKSSRAYWSCPVKR